MQQNKNIEIKDKSQGWKLPFNLTWWEMNVKSSKISFTKNKMKSLGYYTEDFREIDFDNLMKFVHPNDHAKVKQAMNECVKENRQLYDVIYRMKKKNERYSWWYDKGLIFERDYEDKPLIIKGVSIDLSKLKQTDTLYKLSIHILNCLNESNDQIQEVITSIKETTEVEAVGIRIKKQEHYPYYESNGFPEDFIQKATHICNIKNPSSKSTTYACMCGKIIAQNTDSSIPYFTENGSFWTNDLPSLLDENPDEIRNTFTKTNCTNAGYKSVAIIPIKNKQTTIGLLQINDTRENMLSYELIRTLEVIGSSIGIAFARDAAIDELATNEKRFRLAQIAADVGTWDWDIVTSKLIWSEKIESIFGFKKGEFGGTYEAFLNSVHPEDRDFVKKSVNDCLQQKKVYSIEHRIVWPDGTIRWVSERGNVIRNEKDKPIRMLGVVQDITKKKEMENELKKRKDYLKKKVEERTGDLIEVNKKLKEEIFERKKTQVYLERAKNNLRNVIDSATEFIVSFDVMNRISIWNKTAERLTGYKQIDVLNRSVKKLQVFNNPEKMQEYIKLVCENKDSKNVDIVLKTKDNVNRVIRASGSKIIGSDHDCLGSLFMGKDITKDTELHKKLLPGNSYLITDKDNIPAFDLLTELTNEGFRGLIVTRGNPDHIKKLITPSKNLKMVLLMKKTIPNIDTLSNFEEIETELKEFTNRKKSSVVLIDGVHFLLSRFSFESFIKFIYDINDIIVEQKGILFVRIDPSTLHSHQMALLKNELLLLPNQKTEDVIIRDDLYDLIKYIYKQNQNNAIVSVKKVMNEFDVTYVTAASRIDSLEEKGLTYSKKQGKIRAIFVAEKGKRLIHKRKTA